MRGVPQDLRTQNVPVKLLEHQNKNNKIDAFDRTDHQDQNRSRNRPDKRPEKRNDIRHADHHADQHGIRHVYKAGKDHADQSDDQRIQKLSLDKAPQIIVDDIRFLQDPVCRLYLVLFQMISRRKERMNQHLCLSCKKLPAVHKINRHDQSDHQVLCRHQKGQKADRTAADDIIDVRKKLCSGKILHSGQDLL